jgi:DUF2075 family protein
MILYTIILLDTVMCMISWNNQRLLWNHGYNKELKAYYIYIETFFMVRWYSTEKGGYFSFFWPVDF